MVYNSKKFFLQVYATTLIIFLFGFGLLHLLNSKDKLLEVIIGTVVSFTFFIFNFYSITWSIKKSLNVFFAAVIGGMFMRMLFIGFIIFIIMKLTNLDIIYFVGAFLLFFLTYQIIEIRLINDYISKGKK